MIGAWRSLKIASAFGKLGVAVLREGVSFFRPLARRRLYAFQISELPVCGILKPHARHPISETQGGGEMRRASVGGSLIGIAAYVFVGASLTDCVSDLPTVSPSASGGASSSPRGGGSNGAAGGGGNGADSQSAIVTILPSGGASGNAGSGDAAVVPAVPDANCGMQTENPTTQPADLLLVLDRSGSMDDDIASNALCGGRGAPANCTPRWPTLTAAVNQVVGASPAGLQWGLKFFTSPGGGTCTVNPGVDVPMPATAAQIQAAIGGTMPGNATPTTAASTRRLPISTR